MADMMDTLKELLGDDADNKINSIMQIINPSGKEQASPTTDIPPKITDSDGGFNITPEMLLTMQRVMKKIQSGGSDDRTKLLMSLKPYMRKTRRDTIDSAVKMLNMSQLSQIFKEIV